MAFIWVGEEGFIHHDDPLRIPLIWPYFLWGWHWGVGPLDSHDEAEEPLADIHP